MIKLYDLVFEDIEKNNIDLGDKTQEFNEKLELMPKSLQNYRTWRNSFSFRIARFIYDRRYKT